MPFMTVAVRTAGDPSAYANQMRRAVQSVDPDQPIANVRTMDELIAQSVGQRRLSMLLLSLFSGIALVLASIGIYGLMSYSVAQRSRELGVRIALGAARADVLRLVLRQGMSLALHGHRDRRGGRVRADAADREPALRRARRPIRPPSSPWPRLLGLTALAANLVPALRATRVDPAVVLREE